MVRPGDIDIAHPPRNPPPEVSVLISQHAAKLLAGANRRKVPWPLSLFTRDKPAETWTQYEHVYMACLRTRDDENARRLLDVLEERFGVKNERVMAYKGMFNEAMAESDKDLFKVLKDYGEILEKDPINMPIQKRRIALLKTMNKIPEAVAQLAGLLEVSPTDAESWMELSDLYLAQGMFDQSIFCLEEVLLILPGAWNIQARLAEVIYMSSESSGNPAATTRIIAESMRRYLRSIELCDNYLRGYYGLKLTSSRLLELLPQHENAASTNSTYSDLALPSQGTVQALHELATSRLAEIVRGASSGEIEWDGFEEAGIDAARKLLERSTARTER